MFNKAQEILNKINNDIQNNTEIEEVYSYSISCYYRDIKYDVYDTLKSKLEYKNNVQVLKNKKTLLRTNIITEYNKLRLLIKNTSSIKKILEQLERFGFDLSSVKDDSKTALTVINADKDLLFYPNEKQ